MPSASAKLEKSASADAADPVKQFAIILEKKVRNLEKRKLKLDNYKSDVQNGKELNDDQKMAVSKYDLVVELLEYSKDLTKSLTSLISESSRLQKKLAKKEQIERQQHEIQRLQVAFYFKHILSCFDNEDVRSDFLTGENGAVKLSHEDLAHLDQFYRLVGPHLPNDLADIEGHFHSLSENLIFLVEGRNKEIAGTTYKALKELLVSVKESGYFSRSPESEELSGEEEVGEVDDLPQKNLGEDEEEYSEELLETVEDNFVIQSSHVGMVESMPQPEVIGQTISQSSYIPAPPPAPEVPAKIASSKQNGSSLQDVLSSQGNFNFLQESQIELDTPHMDPAVVAVHQMTPPTSSMGFTVVPSYPVQATETTQHPISDGGDHVSQSLPPQQQPVPLMAASVGRTVPSVLSTMQHADFDPAHPIPTQTFTNQSYAVMQNVMISPSYVPAPNMHHGPLPPRMAPIAVALAAPTSAVQTSNPVPVHVTIAPIPVMSTSPVVAVSDNVPKDEMENGVEEHLSINGDLAGPETSAPNSTEKADEGEGFTGQGHFQRGYRGRPRGRGPVNGYYRGRGGYNRGGYQNHNYSQGANFRRGTSRGRPMGNTRSSRGSSNYRPNTQQSQQ